MMHIPRRNKTEITNKKVSRLIGHSRFDSEIIRSKELFPLLPTKWFPFHRRATLRTKSTEYNFLNLLIFEPYKISYGNCIVNYKFTSCYYI
jgi:hypothetical protein